jgi:hypothetical protein
MEIKLTNQEKEEIFYNALCNAVGTGYMDGYGIEMECDRSQYKSSKEHLLEMEPKKYICYEDVLMQVLRDGGELTFIDHEGEGEMTRSITLQDVYERMDKVPHRAIVNYSNLQDDVEDADIVLQTIFFEEVIFG